MMMWQFVCSGKNFFTMPSIGLATTHDSTGTGTGSEPAAAGAAAAVTSLATF